MDTHKRLRQLLDERGWTEYRLSKECGLSESTLANIFRRNTLPSISTLEAICAGFYGTDPEAMGKRIADLIRNSSGHWSYISSSEYSYIGVGVEYREGSQYGWYCCVMVGSVNYG